MAQNTDCKDLEEKYQNLEIEAAACKEENEAFGLHRSLIESRAGVKRYWRLATTRSFLPIPERKNCLGGPRMIWRPVRSRNLSMRTTEKRCCVNTRNRSEAKRPSGHHHSESSIVQAISNGSGSGQRCFQRIPIPRSSVF